MHRPGFPVHHSQVWPVPVGWPLSPPELFSPAHVGLVLRGLALATVQSGANLAVSVLVGIVWTAVSPAVAFGILAAAMIVSVPLILASRTGSTTS